MLMCNFKRIYFMMHHLVFAIFAFTASVCRAVPLNDFIVFSNNTLRTPQVRDVAECGYWDMVQWQSDFHTCFMDKKYADGGRNLNTIVDRILEHAEACLAISRRPCRPTAKSFHVVFGKALEQMRHYADVYLEDITHGRKNIKDLPCVENILSIEKYDKCFRNVLNVSENEIETSKEVAHNYFATEEIKQGVEVGLKCVNQLNLGCSAEALTSLNRMVRKMFGLENPLETQATRQPEDLPKRERTPVTTEQPAEQPWKWYDYIFQPFVKAWNWVSGLFG